MAALEATDPGVILASVEGQKALYPDLSRIAPTIATDAPPAGWELNLRLHGEALGRTNDAEALLTDWDRRAAATRDAIGSESASQTTVSSVLVTRKGVFAAGATRSPPGCWRTWGSRARRRGDVRRAPAHHRHWVSCTTPT